MTKILVTGARGNLGRATAKWLKCHEETEVILAMRDPSKASINEATVGFDFLEPSTYTTALEGIDSIFLVRPPELANPDQDLIPFLKAAKAHGVRKVVFVSLLGIENSPWVPHYKTEQMIQTLGFQYVFLRPSFFMQNLIDQHLTEIRTLSELWIPVGNAKTSFIDADDIGRAAAVALCTDCYNGRAFDLTGSKALTYNEVAAVLSQTLERPIRYMRPNLLAFRAHRRKMKTPLAMINVMSMLYIMTWLGTAKRVTSDLEILIGTESKSFVQFAKEHKATWL